MDTTDRVALLERVIGRFSEWVRFGDAKAAGVLALLGLGLVDLLDRAARLAAAHEASSRWGDGATVLFWSALGLAAAVVAVVSRALFPRLRPAKPSLFFFGSVATYASGRSYREAIQKLDQDEAEAELAEQAWELSRIAEKKYRHTKQGYFLALAFLAAWALSRLALSMAY